jgi:lambda family phage portal protein
MKDVALANGGRIVQGVEFGPFGNIVAYWVYREHPGESALYSQAASLESVRIPASEIAHMFRATRPGQVRGVPWMSPVMRALWDLEGADDAERVRRKLESCAVAAVTGGDPDESYDENDGIGDAVDPSGGGTLTDAYGNVMEAFEPGMIAKVPPGKSIEFFQPHNNPNFPEYYREELHHIAAGLSIPFEVLSGDLSAVNYSSIRMGALEFRRVIRALREHVVTPLLLMPLWRWFVDYAIAAGKLPPGDYPVEWAYPRFEEIDRLKEAKADLQEMQSMITPASAIIAERGDDVEKVFEQIKKDNELAASAGITLPTSDAYKAPVVPSRETQG